MELNYNNVYVVHTPGNSESVIKRVKGEGETDDKYFINEREVNKEEVDKYLAQFEGSEIRTIPVDEELMDESKYTRVSIKVVGMTPMTNKDYIKQHGHDTLPDEEGYCMILEDQTHRWINKETYDKM